VRVRAFRNSQIGDPGGERRIYSAVVETVPGISIAEALAPRWLTNGSRVSRHLRLFVLALLCCTIAPGAFLLGQGGLQSCLGPAAIEIPPAQRLCLCNLRSPCAIDLTTSDKLLKSSGSIDAGCYSNTSTPHRRGYALLGVRHIGASFDRPPPPIGLRQLRCPEYSHCETETALTNAAILRRSSATCPSRAACSETALSRAYRSAVVDFEERSPCLTNWFVAHTQPEDGALDLGRDSYEVGEYLGIVGAR